MSRAVTEGRDGTLLTLWEGTHRECLAYQAGAHAYSDTLYVEVVGEGCECGAKRRTHTRWEADTTFAPQTGCLRCDRWDGPVVLRSAAGGGE